MRLLAVSLALALTFCCANAGSAAAVNCDLYASPTYELNGNGLSMFPFNNVRSLAAALQPGQTGCLTPGTFEENVDLSGINGAPGNPIRITSQLPATRTTIQGVASSEPTRTIHFGTDTSYVEVVGVAIQGRPAPSPAVVVNGTGNALIGNDITHAGVTTCVYVGQFAGQRASGIVIDGNAVHDCGGGSGDPRGRGIGLGYTNDVAVTNNYVYGNPGPGIGLYPDADGTTIAGNVVDGQSNGNGDGAGIQLGGDGGSASDTTTVANNIVSNNESHNIAHNWEGPVGGGNVVRDNCLFSARPGGNYQPSPTGYEIGPGNLEADPLYQNRGAPPGGFALTEASPCKGKGPLPGATTGVPQEPSPFEDENGVAVEVDPTAESVFRATVTGEVNSRFQPTSFAFQVGVGEPSQGIEGGVLTPPTGAPEEVDALFEPLRPNTTYNYRVVAANASGSVSGQVRQFTTPSPPPLGPPGLSISYSHRAKRGGRVLDDIKVISSRGVGGTVSCKGRGCPFKAERPLRHAKLLEGRVLKAGALVTFSARSTAGGFHYIRDIEVAVKRSRRAPRLAREESCTVLQSRRPGRRRARRRRIDCLTITRRVTLYPKRPRFKLLRALNIPEGATVEVRCRGKGCPRVPRCRLASSGWPELSLLGKSKTTRIGTTFTVRVMKPYTRGVFTTIALKRGNRAQSRIVQRFGYLSARTRIPRPCADL